MASLSESALLATKLVDDFVHRSTLTDCSPKSKLPPSVCVAKASDDEFLKKRSDVKFSAGATHINIRFSPWFDLWITNEYSFHMIFPKAFPLKPPAVYCLGDWPHNFRRATPCNSQEQIVEADGRVNLYILSEAGWLEDYPIESIVYSLRFLLEKPNRWDADGNYVAERQLSLEDSHIGSIWPSFVPGQPNSSKNSSTNYGEFDAAFFSFEAQGSRPTMEDAILHAIPMKSAKCDNSSSASKPKYHLLGILDGHGGASCSLFASQRLNEVLNTKLNIENTHPRRALFEASLIVDEEWLAMQQGAEAPDESGTTCCLVLVDIVNCKLYCSNLGDSRALLCRGNSPVELTFDQKPGDPREMAFTVENGGFITGDRINGSLGVARAIGDMYFKEDGYRYMSSEPDITEVAMTPSDRFIFCACDGLYDVMNNDEIMVFILERMRKKKEMSLILKELVTHAIEVLESSDNVSVCVLKISWLHQDDSISALESVSCAPIPENQPSGIRRRARSRVRRTTKLFSQTTLNNVGIGSKAKSIPTATEKRSILSKIDEAVAKKSDQQSKADIDHVEYWKEFVDSEGRPYYFNETTQTSTWIKPETLKWLKATTSDGKVYYYHEETRATSWEKPDI